LVQLQASSLTWRYPHGSTMFELAHFENEMDAVIDLDVAVKMMDPVTSWM
jgi:hypothetical protein